MEYQDKTIIILSQQGVGKSHAMALLTILLRIQREKYRVLYINNPEQLITSPVEFMLQEIAFSFPEEIKTCKLEDNSAMEMKIADHIKNMKKGMITNASLTKVENYLRIFREHLKTKNIQLYMNIDQINYLVRLTPELKEFYENIRMGKSGYTVLMSSSYTLEDLLKDEMKEVTQIQIYSECTNLDDEHLGVQAYISHKIGTQLSQFVVEKNHKCNWL